MDNIIFTGFGIEIIKRDGRYYIRFDAGHFAVTMKEVEVTEAEANKAKMSEKDAYEVVLAKQTEEEQKGDKGEGR